MAIENVLICPTSATVIMSDGSTMLTKSGVLYNENGDVIMTIGNLNKEE